MNVAKPFIVMMYGFPGAGKSALAKQMSDEFSMVHVQEDKILHELFGGKLSPQTLKAARKITNYLVKDYLKAGISVMYDASIHRENDRRKVREMAHAYKAKPLIVWLQVDPETAFERTQKRDKRTSENKYANEYSEDEYRDIISKMQNPVHEDYVVVSGKHTFNTQRSNIVKKLVDTGVLTMAEAQDKIIKPGLTNLIPKPSIQMRGDIVNRNISIR